MLGAFLAAARRLVRTRRPHQVEPEERSAEPANEWRVKNSVDGSFVTGNVVQADMVTGPLTVGQGNIVGDNNVVFEQRTLVVTPPATMHTEPLPPPKSTLCVGRTSTVSAVAAQWLRDRSVVVVGGPGIGKTTVLGNAVADNAVAATYGRRRFVVSCDGAESADAVVDKLASKLGMFTTGHGLRNQIVAFLHEAPSVLVLDNFETVADHDPSGATTLIKELQAGENATRLGIGYRGASMPLRLGSTDEVTIGPLDPDAVSELFTAVAGDRHRDDPELAPLVADLDGVPLAIVLMATLARTEADLTTLRSAWLAKRTDLLQFGTRPDRTSSLPVSIELSWDRLRHDGRVALSLAAFLPDGWPKSEFALYLPDELAGGVVELGAQALLHEDGSRQRVLAPIGEHVRRRHSPPSDSLRQLVEKVGTLAGRCGKIGYPSAGIVIQDLLAEFTNITEVTRVSLGHDFTLNTKVPLLLRFQELTGLGDYRLGREALAAPGIEPLLEAHTAFALAQVYLARGDRDQAPELLSQALPLYQQTGRVDGSAYCMELLGQVELTNRNTLAARSLFEKATELHKNSGDVLGRAEGLLNLGRLAEVESDHQRARELISEALMFYQQVGAIANEADCLSSLGLLELRQSNLGRARQLFRQALPLHRQCESWIGEANCLFCLGDLDFRECDYQSAGELLSQALGLYRRLGTPLGQANCLSFLGKIELVKAEYEPSRTLLVEAAELYRRIGSPKLEANCLIDLGDVEFCESNDEQAEQLFDQALAIVLETDDIYLQAITRAWLTQVTDNNQGAIHQNNLDRLIEECRIAGPWLDHLREICQRRESRGP